jgi:hypothetical protein
MTTTAPEPTTTTHVRLGKLEAVALLAAVSTDPGRQLLHAINVRPEGFVEATNGHVLTRVPWTPVDGLTVEPFAPFMLPSAPLKEARTGKLYLDIDVHDQTCKVVDDYGSTTAHLSAEPVEGTYPHTDAVVPDMDPTDGHVRVRFTLDVKLLAGAAKMIERGDEKNGLEFELVVPAAAGGTHNHDRAIRVTRMADKRYTGVIMPILDMRALR